MDQIREFHNPKIPVLTVNDDPEDNPVVEHSVVIPNKGTGVTAAWNTGIERADTEFILLLNNDVECSGEFIEKLIEKAGDGISGAALRRELTIQEAILQGWCLCFKKQTWLNLGGFDERFRIYYSDTDFQYRAIQMGISLTQVDLPLKHQHAATANDRSIFPDKRKVHRSDRLAFLKKHGII